MILVVLFCNVHFQQLQCLSYLLFSVFAAVFFLLDFFEK